MEPSLARPPRPWALEPDGRGLRIGKRILDLREIVDFDAGQTYEPNVLGHILAAGVFILGGGLFVLPVVLTLASAKFLLGGVLFIAIGATALGEITRQDGIHLFHVDLTMAGGETVRFTSVAESETEALAGLLRSRLG